MDADRRRIGCTRRAITRIVQIIPHCYTTYALILLWITTAKADIVLWQIGGSGLEWAEHDSVAILID